MAGAGIHTLHWMEFFFFSDTVCYNFFHLETSALREGNKKKFQSFITQNTLNLSLGFKNMELLFPFPFRLEYNIVDNEAKTSNKMFILWDNIKP